VTGTDPERPTTDERPTNRQPPVLHRLTVNITQTTMDSLNRAADVTGETRTDTLQKAIQFYAYISTLLASGSALYIQDPGARQAYRLQIT